MLVKKLITYFSVSFIFFNSYSQNEGNIWVTGYSPYPAEKCCVAILDFNNDTVRIDRARLKYGNPSKRASIADSNGKLLFFTDAETVFNSEYDTMLNGDNIGQDNIFVPLDAVLIIPFPDSADKYMILNMADVSGGLGGGKSEFLFYSVIDMTFNGGLGKVTKKRTVLLKDEIYGTGIRAVKHGNGHDWWILLHRYDTDEFMVYLVTREGILGPYIQRIGRTNAIIGGDYPKQKVFSQDGTMFGRVFRFGMIEIFKFDRCTGKLKLWKTWNEPNTDTQFFCGGMCGCSFSDDNNVFYASTSLQLFQYNLTADNPGTTSFLVDTADEFWSCCFPSVYALHENGPDGKIYINNWGSAPFIHVIDKPKNLGSSCNFIERGVYLGDWYPPNSSNLDTLLVGFLPNMPNYILSPLPIYAVKAGIDTSICIGDTVQLGAPVVNKIIYQWTPSEGLNDQTVSQPLAYPAETTTYYLYIIDTTKNPQYSCRDRVDSVTVFVDQNCNPPMDTTILPRIYPNPSGNADIIYEYELPTDINGEIIMHNILGQHIATYQLISGANTLILPVSQWPAGLYLYRMQINGYEESKGKLVVGR